MSVVETFAAIKREREGEEREYKRAGREGGERKERGREGGREGGRERLTMAAG